MKRIYFTLLSGFLFGNIVMSQNTIYNGEDVLAGWWPAGSAGSIDAYDNPKSNGANPSARCVSVWRNGGDDPWTGGGLGELQIEVATAKRFVVMVLKETEGNVQLELQDGNGNKVYLKAMYSLPVNEWKALEFILPDNNPLVGNITTLLIAPHIDDTKSDLSFVGHRMFWDEVVAFPSQATSVKDPIATTGNREMMVYALTGRLLVYCNKGEKLEWATLPNGIYVVVTKNDNGTTCITKIINRH